MAIVARDLDISEKKDVLMYSAQFAGQSLALNGGNVIQTGTTLFMGFVPYPCTIQGGAVFALGISGAPQISLGVQRWAAGATAFTIGISNMVLSAFGTSGVQGLSGLPAAGSTLLNLITGDVLVLTTSVSNTSVQNLIIQLVVKRTQDIVSYQGVST